MKKFIIGSVLALVLSFSFMSAGTALARGTYVHSYYKPSTHSYVQAYHRTEANYTRLDNYSTKGNYNPYTGKWGTKSIY